MEPVRPPLGPLPGSTASEVIDSTLLLIPDAAVWLDEDDRVRAANARAREMFRGDVVGRALTALVTAADGADLGRGVGVRCDGIPFAVETSVGRAPGGTLCTFREPPAAAVPQLAQRHFVAAFETAPIGMALFNPDGEYIRVNGALATMLGRDAAALLGRRDQEFTHPDDRRSDVVAAWSILRGERSTHQCEKRFVRPDGTVVWAIANLAFLRDELGRPISWIGQFQDITARRRTEEGLQRMADHDPLTGLLNRRAFDRELHRLLGDEHGPGGGLLVLDLDGFKAVNDAHGHRAGDDALVRCADGLRGATRAGDLVARLGGDEFAIFAPALGAGLPGLVARIHDAVDAAAEATALGVSVGVATTDDVGRRPDALMAAADARMYEAKAGARSGRAGAGR
ncbi:sensor domain-containing diguanylate cyclase [Patulibacter sp.]|uniref:sensor domain-containing diguanylate cyclase n=1 Tax=Patulibacter sp. TaxID=1912859 RepID=UPI002715FE36|nr:sensor domain-containing diguanylate cyclase [Patulibacter sp.]MDO9407427.1 diguanylate cyclase [Patulibacter sp.]